MYSNIILSSDSYKYSQFNQYPPGTEYVYSYIESRGAESPEYDILVYIGHQAWIREYGTNRISKADIDEAEAMLKAHGEPFYREGWEYILEAHGGRLPVEIRCIEEGIRTGAGVPLVTIVNTDPKCYWLTSFLETSLLRAIWYPTTVASNSYASKRVIKKYLELTGDPSGLDFKLHDFGCRGVSSAESAGLSGLAHLVSFNGTDNVAALLAAHRYYDADMAGFSIPAMEHSTVTSWGRENERDSYANMLKLYGKPGAMFAAVSDSYNIFEAIKMWGSMKDEIIASGATVVIRPDSGEPASMVANVVVALGEEFGYTINSKGYKVLNTVRVIQGDGINTASIRRILSTLEILGWSADNVAFGQGGALLQQVNRDTMKFAMKCSAICVNGEWRDVYKDPVTDSGKRSKRGRFNVTRHPETDNLEAVPYDENAASNALVVRFKDGYPYNETNFERVRSIARA